jgi:hypothetical protein
MFTEDTVGAGTTEPELLLTTRPAWPKVRSMDSSPPLATCGRMIIELIDNGTSRPTPKITLDPPGRFTPGMMFEYVPLFANAIEQAQAGVRREAAGLVRAPPPGSLTDDTPSTTSNGGN